MDDERKTKEQLIHELANLRSRLAEASRRVADLEEALRASRKSERRAQLLVEQVPIAYQSLDEEGRLIEVNQAWLDMLGYSKQEVVGQWFGEFVAPEQHERFRDCLARFKAGGEIHDLEFDVVREDGSSVVVSFDGTVEYDEQGSFEHTHCTMSNVTERVRAEMRERISARQWQATFDAVRDPVLLLEAGGRIVRCNQALADLLGEPRGAIVGRQCQEVMGEEPGLVEGCPYERSLQTLERETAVWQRDGRWFEATVDPMLDEEGYLIGFVHILEDITERKRAEEALRESEAMARALMNATTDSAFLMEPDGTLVALNEETARALGKPLDELVGQIAYDFLPPDVAQRRKAQVEELLRSGQALRFKDARAGRIIDNSIYPVFDRRGTIVQIAVFGRDVTERQRAEEALRESERKFRTLVENVADWVWQVDRNGAYTYVSPQVEEIMGYPVSEVLGKTPFDFMAPTEAERVGAIFSAIAAKRESIVGLEDTLLTKDGREILFETNATPLFDANGELTGYMGICRDITERKRAEEALRESEERFREVVQQSPIGVAIVDPEGQLVECNNALAHIVGFAPEELLSLNFEDFSHKEDLKAEWRLIEELWSGKRDEYRMTKRYIHKDGHVVWVDVAASLVRGKAGEPRLGFAFVQDITERRRAEEALRESEHELRLTLDATTDGIWKWNFKADELFFSPRYYTMLGYEPGEFPASFESWKDLIHPDDQDAAFSVARTYLATKPDFYENEFRLRTKDDDYRWVHSTARVVERDDDGDAVRMIGNHEDITERRRAEEALLQRNRQLALLNQASRTLNASLDPGQVLTTLLAQVRRTMDVTACSVWLLDPDTGELVCQHATGPQNEIVRGWRLAPGEGLAGWVARRGESLIVPDARADDRHFNGVDQQTGLALRSILTVPLQTWNGVIGVIQAVDTSVGRFDEASLQLLEPLAIIAAVAISNARLFEKVQGSQERLQALSQRLVDAQETERRHIARELHDVIGQALTAVKISLQAIQHLLDSPEHIGCIKQRLEGIVDNVEHTLQQVRDLSVDLRPPLLDDLGLVPALRWYLDRQAQQGGFCAHFVADPALERRLAPHVEIACFRIVQEALTNVMRHAQAQRVEVEMCEWGGELTLHVVDDGVGFDVRQALQDAAHGGSLGLLGMQERATLVGGQLEIESAPAQGTTITVRVLLTPSHETEERPL